jgi:hypothetical protein
MIKIYLASPYTNGDTAINIRTQIEVANKLIDLGFCPFLPLLSHFQHMIFPRVYEDWLKLDLEWLEQCDCILRLEGESKGADLEVLYAKEKNIPVFYSIEEVDVHYNLI